MITASGLATALRPIVSTSSRSHGTYVSICIPSSSMLVPVIFISNIICYSHHRGTVSSCDLSGYFCCAISRMFCWSTCVDFSSYVSPIYCVHCSSTCVKFRQALMYIHTVVARTHTVHGKMLANHTGKSHWRGKI